MCFGTVEDCQRWLQERLEQRSSEPKEEPSDGSPETGGPKAEAEKANGKTGMSQNDICICLDIGVDGTTACKPTPHKHRVRFPASKTPEGRKLTLTVCDNHVQGYLATGWKEVAQMVCTRCCTNEPSPGDSFCEMCLTALELNKKPKSDAIRLKEVGYCINRDLVHGCLTYAEADSNMCQFCQNYIKNSGLQAKTFDNRPAAPTGEAVDSRLPSVYRPKIRTIPSSSRPCNITNGCAGSMTAVVQRFSFNSRPELWWHCPVCKTRRLADRAVAIVDLNVTPVEREAIEEALVEQQLRENAGLSVNPSVNPELNDLGDAVRQAVRGMLSE